MTDRKWAVSAPERPESPWDEPSPEVLALRIGALVQEHGSPELRAAARAFAETVTSELRQRASGRDPDDSAPKSMG